MDTETSLELTEENVESVWNFMHHFLHLLTHYFHHGLLDCKMKVRAE